MNDIEENGRVLFQSADNILRASRDLDAMYDSIWEALEEHEFGEYALSFARDESERNAAGWDVRAYGCSANIHRRRLKQKGRAPKVGTMTYIVRLCSLPDIQDNSLPWPWLYQACLFIGWHEDYKDDYWATQDFEANNANNIRHVANGLWAWCEQDGSDVYENAYFFVLPLFALKNHSDLREFVVKPFDALFRCANHKSLSQTAFRGVPVLLPITP